jgi:hypothetical protein
MTPVDLDAAREAECAFGLGYSDGHDVLMLIAPMVDEIRYLRAALEQARSIAVRLEQEVAANVAPF